jgi:uncharacterized protein
MNVNLKCMNKSLFLISFLFHFISTQAQEKLSIFDVARKGTLTQAKEIFADNPELLNSTNQNGFTPLILACYRGNEQVVTFLIENSKTLNVSSEMGTPLMACSVKGNIKIAELLLKKGANVNLTDSKGTTALMYAAEFQNIDLIDLLLKYKANKSLKDKDGKTAFEFAVFSGNQTIINILKNY